MEQAGIAMGNAGQSTAASLGGDWMSWNVATLTPVPMAWQRGWIAWDGWQISPRAQGAVRTRGERQRRARARARMRRQQRTCRLGQGCALTGAPGK